MENIKQALADLKAEQALSKSISAEFGLVSLSVQPSLDCSRLFAAAAQDGLVYVCSLEQNPDGLIQHVFQSADTKKMVDDLNIATLRAIGREDLIEVVLCPVTDRHQDVLNNADAKDIAAYTVLGMAIADYGNDGKPGTGRDVEHWAKISMSMAEQMANMRASLGIVLDVAEVHEHLDRYYRLWLKS